MTQFIRVEKEGPIATVIVDRQPALNALNADVLSELTATFERLAADDSTRVVLLTGAGDKAFVAGADIAAMQKMSPADADKFIRLGQDCMDAIADAPMPVIAVVNGFALGGGCELALACDWIIASNKSVFGLPEVSLGLYPGFGGTQRLTRLVGPARAKELIFTGRRLKAEEAVAWGIVNQMVPHEGLKMAAEVVAKQIADNSQFAIRAAKRSISQGMDLPIHEGMTVEREGFTELFDHPDRVEGLTAFLEKRKANFK
ncbi:MAG: hypothetical protein COV45_02790 [Deltaproteobacteria bacterium CG11_big_fil_rev_8_21_14_0_20_47_16]|nr:MAG: hypothetical protein COV45_02790 [Deltaproteobacteria bacterium CG11_big_fil_rev_8_21_14_0_20_47_16]